MIGLLVGTFQARNAEIFVILPQRAGWTHFAHQYQFTRILLKKPLNTFIKGENWRLQFQIVSTPTGIYERAVFPPLRTCICTAANITDSLQGHAIMHVLYFGLEAHFADFSRMSFFHCQPLNYYRCTRKDRSDNLWKLDQCKGLTAFLTSL